MSTPPPNPPLPPIRYPVVQHLPIRPNGAGRWSRRAALPPGVDAAGPDRLAEGRRPTAGERLGPTGGGRSRTTEHPTRHCRGCRGVQVGGMGGVGRGVGVGYGLSDRGADERCVIVVDQV